MQPTVSDFLVSRLREWGVERLYGYSGDGDRAAAEGLEAFADGGALIHLHQFVRGSVGVESLLERVAGSHLLGPTLAHRGDLLHEGAARIQLRHGLFRHPGEELVLVQLRQQIQALVAIADQ